MRKGVYCLWLITIAAVACVRTPAAIPTQAMDVYEFRQTQSSVSVAVDPIFTVDRTQAVFRGGEDFPEKGLLPVQVVIENSSSEDIQVDPRGFRLIRGNGRSEITLSSYDAFSMVKLPIGWWALGAGFVGGSVPAYRNEARQRDIEARELRETTIAPGKSAAGFVYFAIEENEKNLAGSHITLVLKRPADRELAYDIPIAVRRDIPVPPKSAQPTGSSTPSRSPAQSPSRTEGTGGGVIIRSPAQ